MQEKKKLAGLYGKIEKKMIFFLAIQIVTNITECSCMIQRRNHDYG